MVLPGEAPWGFSFAFSRDNRILATTDSRQRVHLWDATTGMPVSQFSVPSPSLNQSATALAYSPDGQLIAGAFGDGSLRCWEVLTGQECFAVAEPTRIDAMSFSPDGHFLAFTTGSLVRFVATYEPDREQRRLIGHRDRIQNIVYSPDGTSLASSSLDGLTLIWDVRPLASALCTGNFPADTDQAFDDLRSVNSTTAFKPGSESSCCSP